MGRAWGWSSLSAQPVLGWVLDMCSAQRDSLKACPGTKPEVLGAGCGGQGCGGDGVLEIET